MVLNEYHFKYVNQVPIRDGEDALLVNWLEVTEIKKSTGEVTYKNNFNIKEFESFC